MGVKYDTTTLLISLLLLTPVPNNLLYDHLINQLIRTFRQMIVLALQRVPAKDHHTDGDGDEDDHEHTPLYPGIHHRFFGDLGSSGLNQIIYGHWPQQQPDDTGQSFQLIHTKQFKASFRITGYSLGTSIGGSMRLLMYSVPITRQTAAMLIGYINPTNASFV